MAYHSSNADMLEVMQAAEAVLLADGGVPPAAPSTAAAAGDLAEEERQAALAVAGAHGFGSEEEEEGEEDGEGSGDDGDAGDDASSMGGALSAAGQGGAGGTGPDVAFLATKISELATTTAAMQKTLKDMLAALSGAPAPAKAPTTSTKTAAAKRKRRSHVRTSASPEVAAWVEQSWAALGKAGRTAAGKAKAMVAQERDLVGPRPHPVSIEDRRAVEHRAGSQTLLMYVGAHRGCTADSFQVSEDLRRIEGNKLYNSAYDAAMAHDEIVRRLVPAEADRLVNFKAPGTLERQYIPCTRTVRRAAQIQLPLPSLLGAGAVGEAVPEAAPEPAPAPAAASAQSGPGVTYSEGDLEGALADMTSEPKRRRTDAGL